MQSEVRTKTIWLAGGRRAVVLLLPGGPGLAPRAVLGLPELRRRKPDQPVLSLVLVLERPPRPEEENLAPIIASGTLAFDVTLFVPAEALQRAASDEEQEVERLFADEATFTLLFDEGDPAVIARARTSGIALQAGLSANLTRQQSLDVVRALDGHASALRLRTEIRSSRTVPSRVSFECALEEVIGGSLDELDRDPFIQFICPGGGGSISPRGRLALTATDGDVKALALAMQPMAAARPAAPLLVSDLVRPAAAAGRRTQNWWLSDLVLSGGQASLRQLPVVDNPGDAVWRDRTNNRLYWYAPEVETLTPAPNMDATQSPFLFRFRRTGVTGDGRAALTAEVSFTLRKKPSEATRAALKRLGQPAARQVPLKNLSATFSIPYVDERTSELRWNNLPAKVTESDSGITATVSLMNDAVRLAYGALSVAGF